MTVEPGIDGMDCLEKFPISVDVQLGDSNLSFMES